MKEPDQGNGQARFYDDRCVAFGGGRRVAGHDARRRGAQYDRGGRAFSRDVARRGISVFEISHDSGDDIGTLWYTTLAPRLVAAPGLVIGVARASDYFVLGELALRSTGLVEHRCERCTGRDTPVAFLLGPAATRRCSA